jgi:DNA polymerase III delta subunit
MIIFLHGSDSYRRQKKLNYYTEEYRKKYSNLSCDFFDLGNLEEFLRLKEFSGQQLLFDNKKMAVLNNVFEIEAKELKDFFKKYLDAEDFTILISEEKLPPKELEFMIKEAFKAEEFPNFEAEKLRFFIQKEAKGRKAILTSGAINFLAEAYKNDSWGLVNELDKIGLISPIKPIDVEDLKKIGDYNYESPDIFAFINAVSRNWPLARRIIALEKLFISQEEPIKIFNIFASLNWLPRQIIKKLADCDIMIKSGKMEYEEVLVDLALG